ncbi:MAG: tetratricopeptide repeat protein [Verrucomicrobiota bacterium]
MKKVPLSDLDPRLQKQIVAADQQLKTNPQYALEILSGILARNPGCIEVRRSLRKAQKTMLGTKKGLFDGLAGVLTAGKIAKAVEADPVAAIAAAEEALAKKPTDANANKTIALAALKLGFHELAAFAYEELAANEPTQTQHFVDLANVWIAAGEYDHALAAADKGLKLFPGNGDLQEAVRKASVSKTMKKGNWEDKGDFQSKLKDKDEALRLDQSARAVTDAATALAQAAELAQKIQAAPDSLDLYREIVRMFLMAEDLDSAIAWLQRGRLTSLGKADTSLERQESDLVTRRYERISKQLREAIAANPADAASKEALARNEAELADFRLKTSLSLVERYPNDFSYRHELGSLLLAAGRLDEAVQQLQYAQRNPKFRQPALLAIGRAFTLGAKFDLAVEQLMTAKSEVPLMNDLKKEIIYALGETYEKMGKPKEAVDEYKIIYMADSGYRDVAKKINDFYERQKSASA